ncbi:MULTISPECIES: YceI family protein [unclassified Pseudomonas]|uniref:YceI family protein n=1 Tax=unclassified Pseudomonas TaxID=196821 RepID=UPI000BCCE6BB|nr:MULTISPECIES: YceI family protein [unclassified Pseudomonas]PVZ15556.1 polyisoprenoid-binding protein YceI [Pseudomonas sp. URIL14HWK12:I12]PVZ24930.1 polyisoprenoid-binding protein YceI [Pseudomonas sp. URIL14HWK12:I10]PVZ34776.1 polyisoprenoid-binding protein YceI [Pseudomonas sp. URIL14HWK12:I11]SNZ09264.1 Polyisoprenoid-binding protein YceI [Pseudomonas sp. URIL14HWK12:I9]
MLKKTLAALAIGSALLTAGQAMAEPVNYKIDKEGQHAFVDFKISHLGYSFITGTFKDFDGSFVWDADKPENSSVQVTLKTASVFTNHAERDKHISSKDFLDVAKYPEATFKSTKVTPTGKNADGKLTADVAGDLTLQGVTKPVVIKATFLGEGKDPWGGYRAGFEGQTTINRKDFAPKSMDLGPQSDTVTLYFTFEGVKQK